jgi:hypothetical protein
MLKPGRKVPFAFDGGSEEGFAMGTCVNTKIVS